MSFFRINDGRNGTFSRSKVQPGIRYCIGPASLRAPQADVYRPHVPFCTCSLVQFHAQTGRIRNGNFPFSESPADFGQATIALLPNPVGIDSEGLPGAAAPTWVNIAREISKRSLDGSPRSAPSRRKAAPRGLHQKRPEVRIGKWNIYRIQHHRITHFAPVGGDHVSRARQAGRPSKLRHHFDVRRSPGPRRRIFGIGDIIQPFA